MVERMQSHAAEGNGGVGPTGMGPALYNEVYRLIAEWYGQDAGRQTNSLPQLVEKLVQLQQIDGQAVATLAAPPEPRAA